MANLSIDQKAKNAAYMREWNSRPGNREKKRIRDRKYAAENREYARKKSLKHYWENQSRTIATIKRRECHLKRKAVALLGGKCVGCGEDHPGLLQFHHRDPSQKIFSITTKQLSCPNKYPWETILKEIEKCELICANCHFLEHNTWDDEWLTEEIAY